MSDSAAVPITPTSLRVAAIQMVSGRDLHENLAQASRLLERASAAGVELALLPENFALFGCDDWRQQGELEARTSGPIRAFLGAESKRLGLWLVAGSLPTTDVDSRGRGPEPGRVFTRSYVVSPAGVELASYDKIHLFDVNVEDGQGRYRESDDFSPGDQPVVAGLAGVKLGLSICYDLRFPELYRCLVDLGAQLIAVPAAFTYKTGEAHWSLLLRARAIENQCYVLAANQGGQHSAKRQTWGHSCIIDPWGEVLAECGLGEDLVVADIDLNKLTNLRSAMPVLQHRRC